MRKLLLMICAAVCALALQSCASQPEVRYAPMPRPQVPELDPDLAQKTEPSSLCRELLTLLSASPDVLLQACGGKTTSSTPTTAAETPPIAPSTPAVH